MMMPRSRGMEMQIEIARDREEIVKLPARMLNCA
jgi:hypothetical protein